MEAALLEAVRNNHELQSARLEVEKADARVNEAWSTIFPRIDLSARYTHAIKLPVFFLPDFDDPNSGKVTPVEIGSPNAVDVNLSAQQILFNSAVFIGVGTAATYAKAAREVYRATELGTITAVRSFHNQNEWPKGIGNPPDQAPPEGLDWDACRGGSQRQLKARVGHPGC